MLMVSTQISNEMLADGGMNFQSQLEARMAYAVGWTLDDRFVNGTGTGQPLGILNDPALITILKEAGQAAHTLVYENAVKMFERLYPGGHKNAVWLINHSVVPQLLVMSVKIKNAGRNTSAAPWFRC